MVIVLFVYIDKKADHVRMSLKIVFDGKTKEKSSTVIAVILLTKSRYQLVTL